MCIFLKDVRQRFFRSRKRRKVWFSPQNISVPSYWQEGGETLELSRMNCGRIGKIRRILMQEQWRQRPGIVIRMAVMVIFENK